MARIPYITDASAGDSELVAAIRTRRGVTLNALDGIFTAKVSLLTEQAEVLFDPHLMSPEQIVSEVPFYSPAANTLVMIFTRF